MSRICTKKARWVLRKKDFPDPLTARGFVVLACHKEDKKPQRFRVRLKGGKFAVYEKTSVN